MSAVLQQPAATETAPDATLQELNVSRSVARPMQYLKDEIYKFRDAMDRLGTIAAIDPELRFITAADGFAELFGYTQAELCTQPMHFLDYAGKDSVLFAQMQRHLYTGGTWIGDVTCRHKNGDSVEVRISIAPSIQGGYISGYLAQYQRSYVQNSRKELSDVLYRYRAGFNKIAALAIISSAGVIEEVNDMFVHLYGYARSQIIGQPFCILQNAPEPEANDRFWQTVQKGLIWSEEVCHLHKDGHNVYVRSTVAPASDAAAGVSVGVAASFDAYLMINQDITTEWQLRANQNEMAMESGKQMMLSSVLHNIGNLQSQPAMLLDASKRQAEGLIDAVQAASVYCATLQGTEAQEFMRSFFVIAGDAAQQIKSSLQDAAMPIQQTHEILQAWRDETNNVRPVTRETVKEFVEDTLKSFNVQAAMNQISFVIAQMHEAQVQWPISQVRQIVHNLLLNAKQQIIGQIRAGDIPPHRGRIDFSVELESGAASADEEFLLLRIKDNGGGFNVSLEQLFTPRFTTKANGSGIGLHTSAIMAQNMGGSIKASNIMLDGRPGALFELRLPRKIAAKTGGGHAM